MKHLLVIACCTLVPIAAEAQSACCSTAFTGMTYCNLAGGCEAVPTFTTTHKWAVTKPGTLELSGTTFSIVFDPSKPEYRLLWGAKDIGGSPVLNEVEMLGVRRAQDMQDAGLPLK